MTEDDVLIVKRVLSGSREDFALLVERYKNLVFALAYRFFDDASRAEDVAQETFVKVYKRLESFKIEYDFKNWICAITLNVCRDMKRRDAHPARSPAGISPEAAENIAFASRDKFSASSAQKSLIRACVAKLPDKYRGVIVLRYFDGKSYEEIAEITALPSGTVKTYIFRAQKMLYGMYLDLRKRARAALL